MAAPILPTLLKLALPNAIAMLGTALVAVAETSYIGRLGVEPLAGIALVFPFVMLTQMMSAGAMGGGVSSAVSRALGAGNRERAANLALHAAIIGTGGGLFFTAMMLAFGRDFYSLLGGRGEVLEQAMHYSQVLFSGAVAIWLVNTLASVVRGTGDMRVPSIVLIGVATVQVAVGGGLGLGLFGLPKLGMRGVAAGQLTAFTLGALFLAWYLVSGRSRLKLNFASFAFQRDMFLDILKVGAMSCLSPLQSVLTILIFTKILAGFGTTVLAGYGMGSRLEFLLIPIAFAFGTASIPMVGMAMGAGLVTRARRVAWTAAAAAGLAVGLIGLIVAIAPRSGSRCSPAIPASPKRQSRISTGRAPASVSSAPAFACTSPRRARQSWRPRARRHDPSGPGRARRMVAQLNRRAGMDPVCPGRHRHGRLRAQHGAFDPPDALGKMSRTRCRRIPAFAHISDLLLLKPRFFRRVLWPDSVSSLLHGDVARLGTCARRRVASLSAPG